MLRYRPFKIPSTLRHSDVLKKVSQSLTQFLSATISRIHGSFESRPESKAASEYATETLVLESVVGTAIFLLDRRIHSRISWVLSTNVDLKTRIRRRWQNLRGEEVPMSAKSNLRFPRKLIALSPLPPLEINFTIPIPFHYSVPQIYLTLVIIVVTFIIYHLSSFALSYFSSRYNVVLYFMFAGASLQFLLH